MPAMKLAQLAAPKLFGALFAEAACAGYSTKTISSEEVRLIRELPAERRDMLYLNNRTRIFRASEIDWRNGKLVEEYENAFDRAWNGLDEQHRAVAMLYAYKPTIEDLSQQIKRWIAGAHGSVPSVHNAEESDANSLERRIRVIKIVSFAYIPFRARFDFRELWKEPSIAFLLVGRALQALPPALLKRATEAADLWHARRVVKACQQRIDASTYLLMDHRVGAYAAQVLRWTALSEESQRSLFSVYYGRLPKEDSPHGICASSIAHVWHNTTQQRQRAAMLASVRDIFMQSHKGWLEEAAQAAPRSMDGRGQKLTHERLLDVLVSRKFHLRTQPVDGILKAEMDHALSMLTSAQQAAVQRRAAAFISSRIW